MSDLTKDELLIRQSSIIVELKEKLGAQGAASLQRLLDLEMQLTNALFQLKTAKNNLEDLHEENNRNKKLAEIRSFRIEELNDHLHRAARTKEHLLKELERSDKLSQSRLERVGLLEDTLLELGEEIPES